jgi:AraC-like DNA-binding protein
MSNWSTDELRPHERFDYWLEVRIAKHGRGRADLSRQDRRDFRASYSAHTVADAIVSEVQTSSYRFERSAADIARAPVDRFVIVQQCGLGCLMQPDDHPFVIPTGGFSTHHADTPYAFVPTVENDGFHARVVGIPFARCLPFIERAGDLTTQPLADASGMGSLFAAYFNSFVAQAPHLQGAAAEVAVQTLTQLALVARGLSSPRELGRDAVRAGQLERVRQFVGRNLQRADLTPASVARATGMSLRQLHLLFEPTDTTFARYVLQRRLERARQFLVLQPARPILDIALACGIDSPTVFYRGFRHAYGVTPTDYRTNYREDFA